MRASKAIIGGFKAKIEGSDAGIWVLKISTSYFSPNQARKMQFTAQETRINLVSGAANCIFLAWFIENWDANVRESLFQEYAVFLATYTKHAI